MSELIKKKGTLPACRLNNDILTKLWDIVADDGSYRWQASIGTGGDLLGKTTDRPQVVVETWAEVGKFLETISRPDSLTFTVEFSNGGSVVLIFRNYARAGAHIIVTGERKDWVEDKFAAIEALFKRYAQPFTTRLYGKIGFAVIQTVLPLMLSFIAVTIVAALLIPVSLRQSEFLWWITALTVVVTLRLGATISDRMIIYVLKKYPYIKWGHGH